MWTSKHNQSDKILTKGSRVGVERYLGLAHSLAIYRLNPIRRIQSFRHYRAFIKPGDLCFDIGAHVGDRVATFVSLGAKVVAVEPLPDLVRFLNRLYHNNERVTVVGAAVGGTTGARSMLVSNRTPSMSTIAHDWARDISNQRRFAKVSWNTKISVETLTLDKLIRDHGTPRFCKIDIEGSEAEALTGLTYPLTSLSIEYVPARIDVAVECLQRLSSLGMYRFNMTVGERKSFQFKEWVEEHVLRDTLNKLRLNDPTGDIYAALETE